MAQHRTHGGHDHRHKSGCGHKEVQHGDHTDYLHDGHLHHVHGDHVDECTLVAGGTNPAACTPGHACGAHDKAHAHRSDCGHEVVPHADHTDYLVAGHLHHPHGGHCDDHGALKAV